MTYKTLQQLRDESNSHTKRASQLFQEAIELFSRMQEVSSYEQYSKIREEWLAKDAEAREEVRKSTDIFNRFINEIERFKNRDLN